MKPSRSDAEFEFFRNRHPHILLAHGGGGRLMQQLIAELFARAFVNPQLETAHDGAVLPAAPGPLAFTTDSYVVQPIFFPGGDIGKLAVCGTVNDLAMCGARPLYLSVGFILEEGLPVADLWKVCLSMRAAAAQAGVRIVTGDTKVVERGKCDRLFITSAGVGAVISKAVISPAAVQPGDALIVNGDIGRHGIAVMAERNGISFASAVESDCAPLNAAVIKMLEAGLEIHCLRDLTRGGLASAVAEIAHSAGLEIAIEEQHVPVGESVRGACEILGLDPLYVANEGRFVTFLPEPQAQTAIEIINSVDPAFHAQRIGKVVGQSRPIVYMQNRIGTQRVIDLLSGEQLPRIC